MRATQTITRLVAATAIAVAAVLAAGAGAASAMPLTFVSATSVFNRAADGAAPSYRGVSAMVTSPDGRFVYAAENGRPMSVWKVDVSAATPTLVNRIQLDSGLGGQPPVLLLSPDGTYLYIPTDTGVVKLHADDLSYMDPANHFASSGFYDKTMSNETLMRAGVITSDGRYGYFVDQDGPSGVTPDAANQGYRIDLSTMSLMWQHDLAGFGGLALTPDDSALYALDGQWPYSSISQIDTSDGHVIGTPFASDTGALGQMVMSPDGTKAYAVSQGLPSYWVSDYSFGAVGYACSDQGYQSHVIEFSLTPTLNQTDSTMVSDQCTDLDTRFALGIAPDGSQIFVGDDNALSAVHAIATSGLGVLSSITPNGDGSQGLYFVGNAVSPDGTFLYLAGGNGPGYPLIVMQIAPRYALTVAKAGAGAGSVTSDTGGIDCGSTCSASIPESTTSVVLTATADAGSTFAGWSGACTGSSTTCTVTMGAARDVTATFAKAAAGGGTVRVLPAVLRRGLTARGTGYLGLPLVCTSTTGACTASGTVTATLPGSLRSSFQRVIARFHGVPIRAGGRKVVVVRLDPRTYRQLQAAGIRRVRATISITSRANGATYPTTARTWLRITAARPTPVTG